MINSNKTKKTRFDTQQSLESEENDFVEENNNNDEKISSESNQEILSENNQQISSESNHESNEENFEDNSISSENNEENQRNILNILQEEITNILLKESKLNKLPQYPFIEKLNIFFKKYQQRKVIYEMISINHEIPSGVGISNQIIKKDEAEILKGDKKLSKSCIF